MTKMTPDRAVAECRKMALRLADVPLLGAEALLLGDPVRKQDRRLLRAAMELAEEGRRLRAREASRRAWEERKEEVT